MFDKLQDKTALGILLVVLSLILFSWPIATDIGFSPVTLVLTLLVSLLAAILAFAWLTHETR
ncbi:hypothetical protein [Vibrio sp. 10N.261.55.A7]|uniref:hypothetical protein n=1 Tax=Vibrio sp. 10N.261.55.A7 TaxID=1880851 RepID=UPI000C849EEB|nr:hypothetical protein [Vibrio sp. 10N.261.55.A7]PMJ95712.1 hypothetical protein BCU12_05020 [Vibrio sp. 10N.261.55.A7]